MNLWRCNACGGTYRDADADGTLYFHACAPLTHTIIRLADGTETRLAGPLPAGAVMVRVESEEHPNRRDENIRLDADGHAAGVKHEGLGRTRLGPSLLR